MRRTFNEIVAQHLDVIQRLTSLNEKIHDIAERMTTCLQDGGTIFFMGNGGSAADSQHLAAEFVGRFQRERRALPAVALTTDTSILTAVANDYGYQAVFERQVAALCRRGDVVVGISTSGNSENVLRGIAEAKQKGAYTIGLTGENGGELLQACEACLCVPATAAARIQEGHILIGHALCELVEEALG